MKLVSKLYYYIRAIPKTLLFNFYYLPFSQAIKLPIIVCHKTKFESLSGKVTLINEPTFARIRLGFGKIQTIDSTRSRFIWNLSKSGQVSFSKNVKIGVGSKLHVDGHLFFGSYCNFTGDVTIICKDRIHFEGHNLISWQSLFMDTDFHPIIDNSTSLQVNKDKPIYIAKQAWFGTRTTVLKGTRVNTNTIVAAGAVLTGKEYQGSSYLGGNPAKVIGDMNGKHFVD
jgi:acetyltransferase-like isoleucine patch superfamily enzyme